MYPIMLDRLRRGVRWSAEAALAQIWSLLKCAKKSDWAIYRKLARPVILDVIPDQFVRVAVRCAGRQAQQPQPAFGSGRETLDGAGAVIRMDPKTSAACTISKSYAY
jgi:hypothetical protein